MKNNPLASTRVGIERFVIGAMVGDVEAIWDSREVALVFPHVKTWPVVVTAALTSP